MSLMRVCVLVPAMLAAGTLFAQDQPSPSAFPAGTPTAPPESGATDATQQNAEPPGGNRVFGVLPNYRTADMSQIGKALTVRQKFSIASKDSFDYPLLLTGGALAGLAQLTNQQPSFGQGLKGYAHRWITSYADQAMGNMLSEGAFPALLHEDPRYFRRGTGSAWSRLGYAVTRVMVTQKDSGGSRFNYSEWLGNASVAAISNAYYPDGRTVGANTSKLLSQVGIDAISQVLKEFWPDIKHKMFK
jgi:hypothetical protein